MRTKTVVTTLSLLALSAGAYTLLAETAAEPKQEIENAAKAVLDDPYKVKLLQLKSVRDKFQDEIRALEAQVAARKDAINKEDPEVGQLAAEIAELVAKGEEMNAKLNAKYSDDEELKKLRRKANEIRLGYTKAQQELNAEAAEADKLRSEAAEALRAEIAAKKAAEEAAAEEEKTGE